MHDEITWTEPVLCTYDGDVKKEWFVYFEVTNTITGERMRRQFRGGINYQKTKEERIREGNALRKYWKMQLETGRYNPFQKAGETPTKAPATVIEAIDRIIDLKRATLRPKSIRNYNDITGMFKNWLTDNGLSKYPVHKLTSDHTQNYMDYLLLSRKYSGKSHNNQLGILKAIFNGMTKPGRRWISENPFTGIEELPEEIGKNIAYTDEEAKALTEYFREHDKRMYYAVNFVFHCFIRKTELTRIRVGDIDWINRTIRINAADSKNGVQDSVTITEGLHKVLLEMGLDLAPRGHYIFGVGMETCAEKCNRPDDISDRHLRLRRQAGLWRDDGKAFYSWKHTGVVAYWNAMRDIYSIMRQCRHHDLKITMIYMKSLGLMPNEAFRSAKIEL